MLPAHLALRAAIRSAQLADGALTAAHGGSRVYDEPPRGAAFPMSRSARRGYWMRPPTAARCRSIS